MHNLLLLGVFHGLTSPSRLPLDFISLEPLLLIGIGMAAGWVWGKYCSSEGPERQHVAGRDVSSTGCSFCSGTTLGVSADTDAAAPKRSTDYCGSIR